MNKLMKVGFGLLLVATACNTPNDNLVDCDFDQKAMLTNYADEVIIPRFEDFNLAVTLLEGSYNAFAADPTVGLLNEIRISYAAAYGAYQECSAFGFGPGMINGISFRQRFNTFPTNTTVINSNIENGVAVSSSSASTVGFPALDFLLFGESTMTDAEIFNLFTTDVNAANRMAYVGGLITELKTVTTQISEGWATYRNSFIANTGVAQGSSISLVINEFNFDYETLKNFKFKIPLGKFNGGIVLPETVEFYYGGGSVQLAKRQLVAAKEFYLGVGSNGVDGSGLYDYLLCAKPLTESEKGQGKVALADAISDQFLAIEAALDLVADPLSETLLSNKPVVDEAYNQMQMMVPLTKHEMTSALNVQISYQDNDGD